MFDGPRIRISAANIVFDSCGQRNRSICCRTMEKSEALGGVFFAVTKADVNQRKPPFGLSALSACILRPLAPEGLALMIDAQAEVKLDGAINTFFLTGDISLTGTYLGCILSKWDIPPIFAIPLVIYDWAFTTCSMQLLAPKSMRPITAGVTSGGLTGLLVSLAKETLPGPTLAELDQVCADRNLTLNVWGLEFEVKSLVIGIFLGLFLGPVLEVICLLRQLGAIYLRRAFLVPAGPKPACRTWKVLDER